MNRNYHGSRAAKKNPAPKRLVLLLALVLILVGTIGGTVAYLVTHTAPVVNTFTPGKVTCQVEEKFSGTSKTEAVVRNTGNVPAYIRVAVVANTVDEKGDITGAADVSSALDKTDKWQYDETDGYYYYKGIVQPDKVTDGNLLTKSIDLKDIQVTILASAIQSTPADAVDDAWGMSFSNGSWVSSGN